MAQLVEWQIRDLKKLGSSPSWCFWRCRCRICRIRSGVNSRQLWRTQRQAELHAAWPGTVRHSAPPSLLLSWRNTRSILLRPILFCIFGMCSPRRKSAATVRTVHPGILPPQVTKQLHKNAQLNLQNIFFHQPSLNLCTSLPHCLNIYKLFRK